MESFPRKLIAIYVTLIIVVIGAVVWFAQQPYCSTYIYMDNTTRTVCSRYVNLFERETWTRESDL